MSTGQFFAELFCKFRCATFFHKIAPQKIARLHGRSQPAELSGNDLNHLRLMNQGRRYPNENKSLERNINGKEE